MNHAAYSPFVLTGEAPVNLDLFPFEPIYSMSELPVAARKLHNAVRRVSGAAPFFVETVKREKPAVLHAHYGPIGAAVLPVSVKTGVPLITSFYGIDASAFLTQRKYIESFAKLWKNCALISVLSEDMKKALAGAGCPEEKIRIHHLAVDTDALQPPAERPADGIVKVVCSSRLVEKKGVDTLLRAAAAARSQVEIQLDIAGSGPLEGRLRELASELGLDKFVRFHGRVNRAEVFDLMRNANIFALLSRTAADGDSEGTPTALIEAGALGLPSVSTRHAGIPEVVAHGSGGILVEENDSASAAEALARLAADAGLRARMGLAAREKIVAEYSIGSVMRQIEADYLSVEK